MNTSFEKAKNSSDEWYTPPSIFESLGPFDLDPCAPVKPLWKIAKVNYSKLDDGLSHEWHGRVWLNPPYHRTFRQKNGTARQWYRVVVQSLRQQIIPRCDFSCSRCNSVFAGTYQVLYAGRQSRRISGMRKRFSCFRERQCRHLGGL